MNVPDGWQVATLGELGVQARPGFASGKHSRTEGGVQHLRPMNVSRLGRLDLADAKYVEDASDRRVALGDVLFNNTNSPALIGKTALVTFAGSGLAYSNHMTRLRVADTAVLLPAYLALFLHHLWEKRYFESICSNHVNQASVGARKLLETAVCFPPIREQRRIVEMVEEHMAHLDAADASLASAERRLAVAEVSLARSLFDHPSRDAHLWRWSTIGEECSVAVGATPKRNEPSFWEGDIPWVSSGEVAFTRITDTREHISEEALGDRSKRLHPPGTVLLAMIGEGRTRGQAAILDTWAAHNQNCASIQTTGSSLLPDFLYLFLKYKYAEVRAGGSGGNQPALNKARVQAIPVPVPTHAEQSRIIDVMSTWSEHAHRTAQNISSQRLRSAALRRSVLAATLSGRLTTVADPREKSQADG